MTDSELAALQAKIEQLIKERDDALRLAELSTEKLVESKRKIEHLRILWQGAERRLKQAMPS